MPNVVSSADTLIALRKIDRLFTLHIRWSPVEWEDGNKTSIKKLVPSDGLFSIGRGQK